VAHHFLLLCTFARVPAGAVREFCDQVVNTFRWIHWILMPRILVGFHASSFIG
jgi:hypothetical protein